MTIEQLPFDLGEGVVYVAREASDLDVLPLHLQREVFFCMKAALESQLSSLDIEQVKFDSFVEWLLSIKQPMIELYARNTRERN